MNVYQDTVEFGIGFYEDGVRERELQARRLTRVEWPKQAGRLVRKAAEWVGRQRENLAQVRLPGVRIAHGKHAVG
jgi:hypothetical protein